VSSSAKLDKKTVEKVSTLARLKLSDAEHADYAKVLSAVLENFEQIAKVPTENVKPLVTPTDMTLSLRDDVAERTVSSDKLLQNAPEQSGRLYKVPPVV
jgi:aspartyl-tRNA(Asn)/glutamyl-tRNA(Gln) amidotransferase subunit C